MKKITLLLLLVVVNGCVDPANSRECKQAKNRVKVYTESMMDLKKEPSGDYFEHVKRLEAMQGRADSARVDVDLYCKKQ